MKYYLIISYNIVIYILFFCNVHHNIAELMEIKASICSLEGEKYRALIHQNSFFLCVCYYFIVAWLSSHELAQDKIRTLFIDWLIVVLYFQAKKDIHFKEPINYCRFLVWQFCSPVLHYFVQSTVEAKHQCDIKSVF